MEELLAHKESDDSYNFMLFFVKSLVSNFIPAFLGVVEAGHFVMLRYYIVQ